MREVASRTFSSFSVSGFRLMWSADVALNWAEFMEIIILSWFVLEQTESPLILGIFAALRFTGTLAAPFFGVVVDRFGRRLIFLVSRASFVVLSSTILVLSFMSMLNIFAVLLLAACVGFSRTMDNIVRQSVLPDVVGETRLPNGVALSRTGRDVTQIIGPVCGGILMEVAGIGLSYILVVLLYSLSLLLVFLVKGLPGAIVSSYSTVSSSVFKNLFEGFRYVKSERLLVGLLVVAFVVNLTAFPLNQTLLAVSAKDVMRVGAYELGWLVGAYSFGSLLGSLLVGSLPSLGSAGKIMFIGSVFWHIGIIAMAFMEWFYPSIPLLIVVGCAQSFSMVTMAMMILRYTTPEMRGRILGLRQLAVYGLPVGLLLSGYVAEDFGVFVALLGNGLLGIVLLLLSLWFWPVMVSRQRFME